MRVLAPVVIFGSRTIKLPLRELAGKRRPPVDTLNIAPEEPLHSEGDSVLCNVHDSEKAVVIELRNERYPWLGMEAEDLSATGHG